MSGGNSANRSHYQDDIDFNELSQTDAEFSKVYSRNERVDWQDPHVVLTLTKALLRRDFRLDLTLPDDRLCPPVPVRWNYVRWLQEIIDTTGPELTERYDPDRVVTGLDIGVGASCIYGLLACASRPAWRMLGTDIDEKSLSYAQQNSNKNSFTNRIRLKQTDPEDALVPLDSAGIECIDFTVCNPPFYSSLEDMSQAYGGKAMPPAAVCTGSTNEMICEGGDLGFATRILQESLQLRERVRWYSCMLCRLASARAFVERIKAYSINNFAAANIKAGQKTVRWVVAWSFGGYRPRNDVVRHGDLVMALLGPATIRTIDVPGSLGDALGQQIDTLMLQLDLEWRCESGSNSGVAIAKTNVWSRSARRKKAANRTTGIGTGEASSSSNACADKALIVRFHCRDEHVDVRWLYGQDTVLFESLCGMLRLALGQRRGLH